MGGIPLPLLGNVHTNLSIFLHYILLRGQDFCCHPSPYSGNPGLRLFAQSACRHLDCRTALSAQGRVGAGSYLLHGPGDGVPLVIDLSCCLGIQVSPLFPQCRHLCGASLCTPSPSLTPISFINIQPIFFCLIVLAASLCFRWERMFLGTPVKEKRVRELS